MEAIFNKLSLIAFDLVAWMKGYSFKKTGIDEKDANVIYDEEGFSFPEELTEDIQRFKAGTLNYIAYYKGEPAGLVRMADPKVINRAWEHYGIDKEGRHHEIQSLVVRKQFRNGAQFVMLGLVKKIYTYSVANGIKTWSACGRRNVYLTMRRYCKDIEEIDVDFKGIDHPVTRYLVANNIVETYFVMGVGAFAPYLIFKKCVRKIIKPWNIAGRLKKLLATMIRKNVNAGTSNKQLTYQNI